MEGHMSRSRTKCGARFLAVSIAGIVLGASLGGCSDIYYARRESIAPSLGNAIAANEAEQTVDPWPAQSGNRNIGFNGQRMQAAVERYRTNRVVPPVNSTTSDVTAAQVPTAVPTTTQTASSNIAPPSSPSAQ
jgi:hypothetical protein